MGVFNILLIASTLWLGMACENASAQETVSLMREDQKVTAALAYASSRSLWITTTYGIPLAALLLGVRTRCGHCQLRFHSSGIA